MESKSIFLLSALLCMSGSMVHGMEQEELLDAIKQGSSRLVDQKALKLNDTEIDESFRGKTFLEHAIDCDNYEAAHILLLHDACPCIKMPLLERLYSKQFQAGVKVSDKKLVREIVSTREAYLYPWERTEWEEKKLTIASSISEK